MRFILTLAFKNLARYKRRTLITATALAVGLALFVFVDSMLLGADKETLLNLYRYETGVARIVHQEYWENRDSSPLEYLVETRISLMNRLEQAGVPAAPRLSFRGELIVQQDPFDEAGSFPSQFTALDPAQDGRVFDLEQTVAEGRWLEPGEEGVVLGGWLAEDIGAELGYPITIKTKDRDGYYQTMTLPVVGILSCPNPMVNRNAVLMPLATADYYLYTDGAVNSIALGLSENAPAEKRAAGIAEEIGLEPPLSVITWKTMASDYLALAQTKQGGSQVILFLVFVIAAVGISNTMLMSVFERIRELGMMRALGMSDRQIQAAFLLEAAGIGLIGAVLGIAAGAVNVWWLVTYGIDFSYLLRDADMGYRIASVFRGAWNPGGMATAGLVGMLMAVAVAWFPVRKAMKMEVTECLRHQ